MSEWISVDERLPGNDANGDFLVWMDNGRVRFAGVYTFDEDKWSLLRVTHWMPLPQPPKFTQQHLAEIRAAAIDELNNNEEFESLLRKIMGSSDFNEVEKWLTNHANQVRQGENT